MPAVSSVAARRFADNAVNANRVSTRIRRGVTRLTGLTTSGLSLLVVMVLAWIIGRYIGGRPLYLLSYGIFAVLIFSKVSTRRPPPVEGRRADSNPRVAEGTEIAMAINVSSERAVANLVLEEKLPLLFGQIAVLPVASVGP
ncbi:MAG: hypothetical protein H0U92_13260, partial [Actinobacteria bacterium]|nr:hypothetical protein [Actinomycetota bacterium]